MHENPDDSHRGQARLRIIQLEYREAVKANNRFAYHSFLERHPESALALNIRKRLDELDFHEAQQEDSEEAFQYYLKRHPKGRFAEEANQALDGLRCKAGQELKDGRALRAWLKAHPGLSCRAEMERRLMRLRFEAIERRPELTEILDFLKEHQDSPEVRQVEQRLLSMQLEALLKGARFERAEKLVRQKSSAERMTALLARVAEARRQFSTAKAFEGRGQSVLKNAAQALLRIEAPVPTRQNLPQDPRERWLLTEVIAEAGGEEAADLLLQMSSDAYLEVRRRAFQSLARVLSSLDPLRARIWLNDQDRRLQEVARAGPLLLQRALVAALAGDLPMALHYAEQLNLESEKPDIFALALSLGWQLERGLVRDAATTGKRFVEQAHAFAQRREAAWRDEAGLREGGEAWLILRQLHGLLRLWEEVASAFAPGRADSQAAMLGDWLQRAEAWRREHVGWLGDEEARWAAAHRQYLPSNRPAPPRSGPVEARLEFKALLTLALSADASRRPLLSWLACCDPRAEVRGLASSLQLAAELCGRALALPAGFSLGPWNPGPGRE